MFTDYRVLVNIMKNSTELAGYIVKFILVL